jgi:hypothetical protein
MENPGIVTIHCFYSECEPIILTSFESRVSATSIKSTGTPTSGPQKSAGKIRFFGFSDARTKPEALRQNPQIACICSPMPYRSILMANAPAALDKSKLASFRGLSGHGWCLGHKGLCRSLRVQPRTAKQIPIVRIQQSANASNRISWDIGFENRSAAGWKVELDIKQLQSSGTMRSASASISELEFDAECAFECALSSKP